MAEDVRWVELGEGRYKVMAFRDLEGSAGVCFTPIAEPMPVGTLISRDIGGAHEEQDKETYIWCKSREAALVLMEQVAIMLATFTTPESVKKEFEATIHIQTDTQPQ